MPDPDDLKELAAGADPIRGLLAACAAEGWMPGASWWVEARGMTCSRGAVGRAALVPRPEPLEEDTPYDLASLTKPLATALLALRAAEEGALDLGAPVAELLPELRGAPCGERNLLDLAVHRAGLPAWRPLYLGPSAAEGFLAQIADTPPAVPPGQTLYSDLGYILLGAAIERATRSRLDQLFDRWIAGPLELRATGFAASPAGRFARAAPTERGNAYERAMAGEAARGYGFRTHVLRGEPHDANAHAMGGVAGHAGLFGTAEEVGRIAREILRPDQLVLGPGSRRRLLRRADGSESRTFGFVLAAHSPAARGALADTAPGHTGFTGTSLWLDPEGSAVYVLLSNRVHPEVQPRGFQPVRQEFHRVASSWLRKQGAP
jgi:CubicO group peptidase (beta-lactamase class C family)